jgi:P27 family predicted phage terminase small subunit
MSRRPYPAELTSLHGNASKRRPKLTPKSQSISADYPPPDYFSPEAVAEWREALAACASMRTLTAADLGLLTQWSLARAEFIQATRELQKNGVVILDSHGDQKRSPWFFVRNRASEALIRLASEFGFSPASRVRLGQPVQSEPKQPSPKAEGDIDAYLEEGRRLHDQRDWSQ